MKILQLSANKTSPTFTKSLQLLLPLFALLFQFTIQAQPQALRLQSSQPTCIDPSLIDLDASLPEIYQPVCGCDGQSYDNKYIARTYHGVTSWTLGACTACDMEIRVSSIQQNCEGATACVLIEGGQAPYTITFDGSPTSSTDNNLEVCFTNLAPGAYVVSVADALGCSKRVEFHIPIIDYYLEAAITPVSCFGYTDGAIDLIIPVGLPLLYRWTGPNGFSAQTEDIDHLEAGDYQVTVKYEDGTCYSKGSFTVTQPRELQAVFEFTSSVCDSYVGGCLKVQGGTPEYQIFVFEIPDTFPILNDLEMDANGRPVIENATATDAVLFESPNTEFIRCANGIPAGIYLVVVLDANGCYVLLEVEVPEANPLQAEFEITSEPCAPQVDGCLTISGGTEPYRLWVFTCPFPVTVDPEPVFNADGTVELGDMIPNSDVDLPSVIYTGDVICADDIPPAVYYVVIADRNNCWLLKRIVIDPSGFAIEGTVTNATCAGNDGAIDISVRPDNRQYFYRWSNGATTQDIEGLSPGTYTVQVYTENDFCTAEATFTVGAAVELRLNLSFDPYGEYACVEPEGNAPYEIVWTSLDGHTIHHGIVPGCVFELRPGIYLVEVTDAAGCTGSEIFIIEPNPCQGGIAIVDPSEIRSGQSTNFKLRDWSGIALQWQFKTDFTDWLDIPNATGERYHTPPINTGSDKVLWVRALVICEDGSTLISAEARLFIHGDPTTVPAGYEADDRELFHAETQIAFINQLVSVFPSVTQGPVDLRFNTNRSESTRISVLGMDGRRYEEVEIREALAGDVQRFDFSDYPSGMYFIRIEMGADLISRKIMNQRF